MLQFTKKVSLSVFSVLIFLASINVADAALAEHGGSKMSRHTPSNAMLDDAPWEFSRQFIERHDPPNRLEKSAGLYSATDWQAVIDSTWGPGLTTAEKIAIYSNFWNWIDVWFACFNGLD